MSNVAIDLRRVTTVNVRQARQNVTWFELTVTDIDGNTSVITIWPENRNDVQLTFGEEP